MKSVWIGLRIWAYSVILNALLFSFLSLFSEEGLFAIFLIPILGFFGFVFTVPLVTIITPIIDLAGKIPNTVSAKISWLTAILLLTGNLYLLGLKSVLSDALGSLLGIGNTLYLSVSIAIISSVVFLRSSLTQLYKEKEKNQMDATMSSSKL